MSAIDFPASPTLGQSYTTAGGIIYIWDGVSWVSQGGSYLTSADIATAAQWQAAFTGKILGTDATWSGAAPVVLTDASTIAVDMSTFINASVTLGGNRTLGNPTNTKAGQSGYIKVVQDGTGSRTLAYASNWKFPGGFAPILSTAASAKDFLFYQVESSTFILAMIVKNAG
jgi:hypothetical protein